MEFEIPDKLSIGGVDIEVKKVSRIENSEVLGQCCLSNSTIQIADYADGITQSNQSKVQTFWHEVVHCILDTMCERELSKNEKFVCVFSSFLNEAIKSMEQKRESI